jgi:DNA polymerase-3 subunit delta'
VSGDQSTLLPWQGGTWRRLQQAHRSGRLPHALLVTGPAGVGKRHLADLLTRSLLCSAPDPEGLPCGRCRDCLLLAAGSHPDRIEIGPDPEGKSDEIKVDRVRRLGETDALTAHRGGWKLIRIDPAHRMNASAANSLLKTLEEPTAQTLILLLSEHPARLAATIRSRCQILNLPLPDEDQAMAWLSERLPGGDPRVLLHLAHGAPLAALALADRLAERERLFAGFLAVARGERDPIAEAAAWSRSDLGLVLDWLAGWLSDLLRHASGHPTPRLINVDKAEPLERLARSVRVADGHRLLQRVLAARGVQATTVNALMTLESLLIEWGELARPAQ